MFNSYIFSKKNDNEMQNKQFERKLETLNYETKKDKIFNKLNYIERPEFYLNEKNDTKNNFYDYNIPQKASLGYNVIFEEKKKIDNEKMIDRNNEIFSLNNTLPNNIYHNFAENTRLSKKSFIEYNINDRNKQERIEHKYKF